MDEAKVGVITVKHQDMGRQGSTSGGISEELIVKEVECETVSNSFGMNCTSVPVGGRNKVAAFSGSSERSDYFTEGSKNALNDLYSWNFNSGNGNIDPFLKDDPTFANNFSKLQMSAQSKSCSGPVLDKKNVTLATVSEESYKSKWDSTGQRRKSWLESTSERQIEVMYERNQKRDHNSDQPSKPSTCSKDQSLYNPWSTSVGSVQPSSNSKEECSIKTVFPFPMADSSSSFGNIFSFGDNTKERKQRLDSNNMIAEKREHLDGVDRLFASAKSQGCSERRDIGSLSWPFMSEEQKEELPQLPPVNLKSEDKSISIREEKVDRHGSRTNITTADNAFLIGSFLDIPVGQEINSSGGSSEFIEYPNEYWDSDEYDDDEDVGYMRQPIEDEAWFLAHEIDYPSDNEKGTEHGNVRDWRERGPTKGEDDVQLLTEESYFSGEQYIQPKHIEHVVASDDSVGLSMSARCGRINENDLTARYDGQLVDEELKLMSSEPVWHGFVTQTNDPIMFGNGSVLKECGGFGPDYLCIDNNQHGSVRSIGVGISNDVAHTGSLVEGSREGDLDLFLHNDVIINRSRHSQQDPKKSYVTYVERSNQDKTRTVKPETNKYIIGPGKGTSEISYCDGGFSLPTLLKSGNEVQANSGKALFSSSSNVVYRHETDACGNGLMGTDDMLATWRQKSSDSPPVKLQDENVADMMRTMNTTSSTLSNCGYAEREYVKKVPDDKASDAQEDEPGTLLEDEEAVAVQDLVRQVRAQEEEFETFNLRIVHRKNRTGFEEDKNFHVGLNSVIAGRYHVTEYLGSAAFSKAVQAHDLQTGMDVCVKIIKNNKEFFDQSLDEIKLLKFINKNDPADKYHILRLYDYFYYREHLLIVCELLKANLYEFHKFNRESGGEVYFTMPRLQSIAIQCLEALQFLHGLGLIHCDLKPENILVKSYSRCEVKVIDFGSSCFQTDHLCSYVQSRSYRAPEVILGLPYDKKIDIWSLGCILAELCTGNVLFQNDSSATLLASVIGIIGSIDRNMLAKGQGTHKYFTKNHMLYERNQDNSRLEYLIPKKTSLRHRLPMGDQGFIDFVAHLLEINPKRRPTASEALKHQWLSYPYEPISS
ncbi:Protein kinase domain-containing protein [Cinnamomum micranthum f. kanehirae]|uniref:Protein kinase domain-containing protein n=1 Tax=Cinnamomum micranthum f. kanehirae TaxID=337451 RepID=A0A443NM12_9MAGN|nr:Protein kinase domain-containing protein [Cinnamomum micranthum f. kanehirae]